MEYPLVTLPLVFDLESGETHYGVTAFELSEVQGRKIAPSFERGPTPHYHRVYNKTINHKRSTMPDETADAPVETTESTETE